MSNEHLEIITAKPTETVSIFDEPRAPQDILNAILHCDTDGWVWASGDPEFWKFRDRLLVPGGRVLDLGMGFARTSLFFSLQGMKPTAYEVDPNPIKAVTLLKQGYGFPITIVEEDITKSDLGNEEYDTVMLGQTFVHFESKARALHTLQKAVQSLKPGGHIWVRAGTKEDSSYKDLDEYKSVYPMEVAQLDKDVFLAPCTCSGEYRIDPQLFFDPLDIPVFLSSQGLRVVHTQLIPETGRANIMYGEDWHSEQTHNKINGLATVLAQKIK